MSWYLQPVREYSTGILNRAPQEAGIRTAQLTRDGLRGSCQVWDGTTASDVLIKRQVRGVMTHSAGSYYQAWLGGQDGPGDATVPAYSGRASKPYSVCFAEMHGFDHQNSYKNPEVQAVTLYSILKIATLAQPLS